MSCVAHDWLARGKGRYRSCYDERGKTCCRADLIEVRPGEWSVRVRQGSKLSVSFGTYLDQSAALHLANVKLGECGCSGTGIAFGVVCGCGTS